LEVEMPKTILKLLKRPVVFGALGVLLAFFMGDALAERIEKRAAEDRLYFGMAAETCVHASCTPPQVSLD
jgi:hypothetical protein